MPQCLMAVASSIGLVSSLQKKTQVLSELTHSTGIVQVLWIISYVS